MNKLLEFVEREGLVHESHVSDLSALSAKKVVRLYESLYSLVQENQYSDLPEGMGFDPFRFLASASFRGDYTSTKKWARDVIDLTQAAATAAIRDLAREFSTVFQHLIPIGQELPLRKLLRIRGEQRDAFMRYRAAIYRILREVLQKKRQVDRRDADEIYRTWIEPELRAMRSNLEGERRKQWNRLKLGATAIGAAVAIGAFGSVLPGAAQLGTSFAAGGVGAHLLGQAAESSCSHGHALSQNNDFYFLLRLCE